MNNNLIQMKPRYVQNIINKFCYSIGMIPTSYKIALTYEEQILAIGNYLENTVYPAINSNAEALQELQNLYIELKDMIDNLDLQDEVNHKINELVESGTLAELINQELLTEIQKINSTSKVAFLSPDPELHKDFGDCCVITGEKNIIIDLGFEITCETLISYLFENNINKIDYIIISHYHKDHIGGNNAEGLIALLSQSSIDFSNCTVILPHKNINYGLFLPISQDNQYRNVENNIINILNTNNINYHYPDNEEIITLGNYEQLQFFNIGSEFYNDYYNITNKENNIDYTIYNNFSLVVNYKHFDNDFWFTGDIEFNAQENIYKFIKKCDVLKVEHHGLNRLTSKNYLHQLNPKFAYIGNRTYYQYNNDFKNITLSNLLSKNCKVFASRYLQNTVITSSFNNIICNNFSYLNLDEVYFNLLDGNIIPQNSNLNDFIYSGTFFSPSSEHTHTLLNAPTYNHNPNDILDSGFKLIVMNNTNAENRITQLLFTSNNKRKTIAIRMTQSGSFENTNWAFFQPSEDIHFVAQEFIPLIDTLENDITLNDNNTQAYKANLVSTVNIAFHTNEELQPLTDILLIPKYIINLPHNISFVLASENDDKAYGAYLHSYDDNYMSLRVRTALPTNKNFYGSITAVNRSADNL